VAPDTGSCKCTFKAEANADLVARLGVFRQRFVDQLCVSDDPRIRSLGLNHMRRGADVLKTCANFNTPPPVHVVRSILEKIGAIRLASYYLVCPSHPVSIAERQHRIAMLEDRRWESGLSLDDTDYHMTPPASPALPQAAPALPPVRQVVLPELTAADRMAYAGVDAFECSVCMVGRPRTHMFDCGHKICLSCVHAMADHGPLVCHLCRHPVKMVLPVFD